ncbi:hypothetical protein Rhopal_005537-T1 [Rhodotorula paludigena]|uniref:Uncharacterized protein n=1 Tax=Rhodotorula paludigena TaxID=86838 RepID=A0AAV5GSM9_9BASI|nr:hypothetical protein Rhopal_005537-T1 [Rhodotorula paludigena]
MLVWATILLLCLARALTVPLEDQLAFVSSSSPPLSDPATLPRNRPAWFDPRERGGSMLNRNPWGGHEPLNIVISARSSPDIVASEAGFIAYSRSLGLWNECANLHIGDPQVANLGDGKGWEQELFVMRESRWPFVGSCLESFTAYKQNGTEAHSNAWFLAASKEVDIRGNHKVAKNGYNVGRDLIVEKAIKGTSYLGRSWEAEVEWIEGLLEPGNRGINHGISQDGRVAVLTVTEY